MADTQSGESRSRARDLARMPREVAAGMHTVFTDIDDTLTTEGRLTASAYQALQQLSEAGFRVIPVTGRPAGWCDHIARMWPVDAVIAENGACYYWHDREAGRLKVRHLQDDTTRRNQAARRAAVRDRILAEVPGAGVASDQFCRLYDLAIDFCEDVPPLEPQAVDRIVRIMTESGMTAKVSSIHVNGWFGSWDKLGTARLLMQERYGVDLEREREHCVFAGDSPNDEPMFAFFPHAVGVANVRRFAERIRAMPAWICAAACGAGFVELARYLLDARPPASVPAAR